MVKKYLIILAAACGGTTPPGHPADLGPVTTTDLAQPPGDFATTTIPRDFGTADLASADRAPIQTTGYGSDGPSSVTTTTVGGWTAHVPGSAGAHPVVILASGLQQPAAAYAPYARRLASWGIVTLTKDDPGFLGSTAQVASDIADAVTKLVPAQNQSGPLAGKLDPTRIGLAGHSRGGQASLLALEGGAKGKVKAWFGIDPVDSQPPGGGGTQARTALPTLGVPTVFLGETTDGSGGMACAPSADNYHVLFGVAPPPSVEITAVGADHTQFEDPASCAFCGLCTKGSADGATVLAGSVRYLATFFAHELLGDAGATLDAAAGFTIVTK